MEKSVAVDDRQIQVRFVTKLTRYAVQDTLFSIPASIETPGMNELISGLLKEGDPGVGAPPDFEFLIAGEFLPASLGFFIDEKGLSTEEVVEIEYLEKFPAPEPFDSLTHDDWVILTGCYDNMIHIWNDRAKHLLSIPGHSGPVKAVKWLKQELPDGGRLFVSASHDQTVRMWKWFPDKNLATAVFNGIGHQRTVEALAIDPNQRMIASGSFDTMLKIWSADPDEEPGRSEAKKAKGEDASAVEKRVPVMTFSGHVEAITAVVWHLPDEICTVSWDQTIRLWDAEMGGVKAQFAGSRAFLDADWAKLRSGPALLTASADRHIRLYDPRSPEGNLVKVTFTAHNGWVTCVKWSQDNEDMFVSGGHDMKLKLWDIRSPKVALYDMEGHEDKIMCCDWSVSSMVVSGGSDSALRIFRIPEKTLCGEVPPAKLAALQKVLQSDFFNAVREVYEHVYETVDISGSPEVRASATAKATVAAFAASEGHAHPRVVELPKTEEGLGFNVMGGREQNSPIYISRIIPGGVADRHGGLKRGDQLLSVNGVSVEGEPHEKAVELLKAAHGTVKLVVRYTPKVLEEMEARFDKQRQQQRRKQTQQTLWFALYALAVDSDCVFKGQNLLLQRTNLLIGESKGIGEAHDQSRDGSNCAFSWARNRLRPRSGSDSTQFVEGSSGRIFDCLRSFHNVHLSIWPNLIRRKYLFVMALSGKKAEEALNHIKEAEKALKTSLLGLKFRPDYDTAADEYKKAATCYKVAKCYKESRECLLKAHQYFCEYKQWFGAAKCLDDVVMLCKELGESHYKEAFDLSHKACTLYQQQGSPETAALSLSKTAQIIENAMPQEAAELYSRAAEVVMIEDRPKQAAEYTAKVHRLFVKLKLFDKALKAIRREMGYWRSGGSKDRIGCLVVNLVLVELARMDTVAADKAFKEWGEYCSSEQEQLILRILDAYSAEDEEACRKALTDPYIKHMDVEYAKLSRDMEFPREFSVVDGLASNLATGMNLQGNDSPVPDLPLIGSSSTVGHPRHDLGDEDEEGDLGSVCSALMGSANRGSIRPVVSVTMENGGCSTRFILGLLLVGFVSCSIQNTNTSSDIAESLHYLNYVQMTNMILRWKTQSPLLDVYSIGKSQRNRELWVLKLSTNLTMRPLGMPMFKIVANMHGDESVGRVLCLGLVEFFLKNYPQDPDVKRILDTTEIHCMPSMNPDGFEFSLEHHLQSKFGCESSRGRRNFNGVDLNRNFPSQWNANVTGLYQPETLAVMRWIIDNNFVLSLNMHGGSRVVSYPYDDSSQHVPQGHYSASPDDAYFQRISKIYASSHPLIRTGKPECLGSEKETFPDGITNGAHWYDVEEEALYQSYFSGGMQDFNYKWSNCFEVTVELTCCKFPRETTLAKEWEMNKRSMMNYIQQVHLGVKGIVRDDLNRNPIGKAVVVVQGIDHNITTSSRGEYWRLLVPGTYTITVVAAGYHPQTKNVSVLDRDSMSQQDFTLTSIHPVPIMTDTASPDKVAGKAQEDVHSAYETVSEPIDHIGDLIFDTEELFSTGFLKTPSFRHHNYSDMVAFLLEYAAAYPRLCRLYSIGNSVQNRELYVMEISDNPGMQEPGEPEVKLVGNMHGDEAVGREILLTLIQLLLEGYGPLPTADRHKNWTARAEVERQRITHIVNATRLHILPSMNPDGYEKAFSHQGAHGGRENANEVDLNRDFPDFFHPSERSNKTFQPETQAVMNWSKQHHFVLSANFHGGAVVANYPFDNCRNCSELQYSKSPDDAIFKKLALAYSKNHGRMKNGCVCDGTCFSEGITNGNKWYSVNGGMQDWNYHELGTFEITMEVSCEKFPAQSKLPGFWIENRVPILEYISQVHRGIHGFISSTRGIPVPFVNVSVVGIDKNVTSTQLGDYWRLLSPGKYEVAFQAEGFLPTTKEFVVDENRRPEALLNVTLVAVSDATHLKAAAERMLFDAHAAVDDNLRERVDENMDVTEGKLRKHTNISESMADAQEWAIREDASVVENVVDHPLRYSNKQELYTAMAELESRFPDFAEFLTGGSEWSILLKTLKLAARAPDSGGSQIKMAIFGMHPMGSDHLVRMARHLCAAGKKWDAGAIRILSKVTLYLVPLSFREDHVRSFSSVCGREIGLGITDAFTMDSAAADSRVRAVMQFLRSENVNVVVTLDGQGNFARLPSDVSPSNPDQQAEYLASRLRDAATETMRSSAKLKECYQGLDPVFIPISGPVDGYPVVYTPPQRFADALINYASISRIPAIDIRFSCCDETESPVSVWQRVLPALESVLLATTFSATGVVKDDIGEPLPSANLTLQGAETRLIRLNEETARFRVVLPPGLYLATIGADGFASRIVQLTVKQQGVPDKESLSYMMERKTLALQHNEVVGDGKPEIVPHSKEKYHSYREIETLMNIVSHDHPDIAKLHSIGKTVEGRVIFALEFTNDVQTSLPGRAAVAVISGLHGSQHSGPELVMDMIHDIVDNRNGSRISKLLKRVKIFLIPLVNADSFEGGVLESSKFCDRLGGSWYNKNSVDLAFDFRAATGQPETEALKGFFRENSFIASVIFDGNVHESFITYPWYGDKHSRDHQPPDSSVFRWLASEYRGKLNDTELQEHFHGSFNVLCAEIPKDQLSKGFSPAAAVSPRDGAIQDFVYETLGVFQFSVFLGCCNAPSYGAHMALWRKHKPAVFHLIDAVTRHGVKGFITTAATNEPIPGAQITIETSENAWTGTSRNAGQFFRLVPLNDSAIKMSVAAEGYFGARKEVQLLKDDLTAIKATLDKDSTVMGLNRSTFAVGTGMIMILVIGVVIFMHQKRQNCRKARREAGFHQLNSKSSYIDDSDEEDIDEMLEFANFKKPTGGEDQRARQIEYPSEDDEEEEKFLFLQNADSKALELSVMFFKYNYANQSKIDSLLQKEDVTLQELMDENDIIQECQGRNSALVEFLVRPENLDALVDYISEEPAEDVDEVSRYKYPNVACELLTCDVPLINEKLADSTALLEKLCGFIEKEPPLNPLMASFFSRTLVTMITRKTDENWFSYQLACLHFFEFIQAREGFVQSLISHMGTSAIMDVLLKLMVYIEGSELRVKFTQWLCEQQLVERLVSCFDASVSKEVHVNVAQLLCDMIGVCRGDATVTRTIPGPSPNHVMNNADADSSAQFTFLKQLESKTTLELMLRHMLGTSERSESAVYYGIKVLIALIASKKTAVGSNGEDQTETHDRGDSNSPPFSSRDDNGMRGDARSTDSDESGLSRIPCGVRNVVEALLPWLSDIHRILLNPPIREAVRTTVGVLDPPLGSVRLQIANLVTSLIMLKYRPVSTQLVELGTLRVLFDLFFAYQWNNFLHRQVVDCVLHLLSTEDSPKTKIVELSSFSEKESPENSENAVTPDSPRDNTSVEEPGGSGREASEHELTSRDLELLDPLLVHLLRDIDLLTLITREWSRDEEDRKNKLMKRGYMGHLVNIIQMFDGARTPSAEMSDSDRRLVALIREAESHMTEEDLHNWLELVNKKVPALLKTSYTLMPSPNEYNDSSAVETDNSGCGDGDVKASVEDDDNVIPDRITDWVHTLSDDRNPSVCQGFGLVFGTGLSSEGVGGINLEDDDEQDTRRYQFEMMCKGREDLSRDSDEDEQEASKVDAVLWNSVNAFFANPVQTPWSQSCGNAESIWKNEEKSNLGDDPWGASGADPVGGDSKGWADFSVFEGSDTKSTISWSTDVDNTVTQELQPSEDVNDAQTAATVSDSEAQSPAVEEPDSSMEEKSEGDQQIGEVQSVQEAGASASSQLEAAR
ncbi:unnamed protein product [Notodromas monacha]|uniref:Ribosome biogenesis protein WDR12 homolog n=1 Tax=Notodromas monacha TaxID=399045 RepID=A0A7R9GCI5_9CRUS|nr:unnamed protein product [Notodromas monacha]CAG0916018.1 unnamed protein product [Notodromas monacha]